ncbi:pentapeptide repeat protein [Thalassoporum mexicanum PCC 7367]|uniref:pentapeptide repeat-containing protein n=1 Tax=Thalassoporum mexicanum TaxID=3457544 RepID=UPI00029FD65E|nr:pentapeptide repeat-containing protein [Pseudanabaena sp. PCC 7367]AFY71364.1 pentapeptide repeat protein [Pseudanabaena sp. PCC 7367]
MATPDHLNFAQQDLRNRCFRQHYLRDANFEGADIRGCDFRGATLVNASFEHVKAGLSQRQVLIMLVYGAFLTVMIFEAIFFALIGQTATAIALITGMAAAVALVLEIPGSLLVVVLITAIATISDRASFSLAIAISLVFLTLVAASWQRLLYFLAATAAGFLVVALSGFAGNLAEAIASPHVMITAIVFAGVVVALIERDLPKKNARYVPTGMIAIMAIFGLLAFLGAIFMQAGFVAVAQLQLTLALMHFALMLMAIAGAAVFGLEIPKTINQSIGTSFRDADLTDANFNHANLANTDLSYARTNGTNWGSAQFRKCVAYKFSSRT